VIFSADSESAEIPVSVIRQGWSHPLGSNYNKETFLRGNLSSKLNHGGNHRVSKPLLDEAQTSPEEQEAQGFFRGNDGKSSPARLDYKN
jgi:hypothetical protein